MEENGDKPTVGLIGRLFQVILGFLAFLLFLAGLSAQAYGWSPSTFVESLPCYALSFVFLIFMLAIGLSAQSSSQEPLEREKIKASN